MKTPREVLLQRHQSVAPRLDDIRRVVVADVKVRPAVCDQGLASTLALKIWRELVWPCRRTWAGLAAAWLVLAVFNFMHADHTEVVARNTTPPSPEVLMVLRQQQLLLAELVERPAPRAADRPKTVPARPRSQRQGEMGIA